MSLDPKSIALHGIGYGALAIALVGFVNLTHVAVKSDLSVGGPDGYADQFKPWKQDQQRNKLLAQALEEDEIILGIIVESVTNRVIT